MMALTRCFSSRQCVQHFARIVMRRPRWLRAQGVGKCKRPSVLSGVDLAIDLGTARFTWPINRCACLYSDFDDMYGTGLADDLRGHRSLGTYQERGAERDRQPHH
jgi:hypothetical protein